MKLNVNNFEYDEDELNSCCGVTLLTDLYVNHDNQPFTLNLAEWKEHWDELLAANRAGMLMATTSTTQTYAETIFKRTKWKKARSVINPKTRNTISVWTYA